MQAALIAQEGKGKLSGGANETESGEKRYQRLQNLLYHLLIASSPTKIPCSFKNKNYSWNRKGFCVVTPSHFSHLLYFSSTFREWLSLVRRWHGNIHKSLPWEKGTYLAWLVEHTTLNLWYQGCEFESHVGGKDYFKKKKFAMRKSPSQQKKKPSWCPIVKKFKCLWMIFLLP